MTTLAEEEVADNLLTQIARELMGGLRTGAGTTAAEDDGVSVERDRPKAESRSGRANSTMKRQPSRRATDRRSALPHAALLTAVRSRT
jgi:hypothetical protein